MVELLAFLILLTAASGPQTSAIPIGAGGWITPADYPPAALRAEAQGRVSVELDVDPAGRVATCRITGSSGSSDLDAATCGLITRRARFVPADGEEQGLRPYATSVRWTIPTPTPASFADWTTSARMLVEPDGKVLACAEDVSGPVPSEAAGACRTFLTAPRPLVQQMLGKAGHGRHEVLVQNAMRVGGAMGPAAPPVGRWAVTSAASAVVSVGPDGRVLDCRGGDASGVAAHLPGLCTYHLGPFAPADTAPADTGGVRTATVSMTIRTRVD